MFRMTCMTYVFVVHKNTTKFLFHGIIMRETFELNFHICFSWHVV